MTIDKFFESEEDKELYLELEKEVKNVEDNSQQSLWSITKLLFKSILSSNDSEL